MVRQALNQKWYHERKWAAVIIVASLIGRYIFASLAIDSGSLLQYFAAIALLILAVNRAAHIVAVSVRRKAT
jgi:hypothetical protein